MITRRKPISKVSQRQARRNREYAKVKIQWLASMAEISLYDFIMCEHPTCAEMAIDVHHTRGKDGPLYFDTRYWKALCRFHHTWVGNHPDEARKLGLLCEKGLWNVPDRTPL